MSSELKRELESLRLEDREAAPRRGKGWLIGLVLALVVVAAALYLTRSRLNAVDVQAVTATRLQPSEGSAAATGTAVLTASGYLVARREAVVSAKIQGRLSDLRVEEGAVVREGDVLARLESQDYEAQLARAKAQLGQVEAQNARTEAAIARADADLAEARRLQRQAEQLVKDQVVARDTLEAAQSRVRVGEAALEQARADRRQVEADRARVEAEVQFAQAQLANTVIRAPFAGTVVKKMAEIGESVAPIPPGVNISTASGAIVALADLATIEMEADVNESNVARLVDRQPAQVEVEAFPDKRYRAVLRQIIPTADRTKATVMVKVTLVDKDRNLKPEMSAKVTFLAPDEASAPAATSGAASLPPQVLVPQTAVVSREGGPKVFEIIDNVIRVRSIVTASTRGSDVVVTRGLSGGETLVASPTQDLAEGTRVRIRGT